MWIKMATVPTQDAYSVPPLYSCANTLGKIAASRWVFYCVYLAYMNLINICYYLAVIIVSANVF